MTRLTRRKLFTAAVAVAAVTTPAQAQTASKDDDLKNAHESIANNSAQLAKVELPISTEPAFIFKA